MCPPVLTCGGVRADSGPVTSDLDEGERRELRRKVKTATLDAMRFLGGEARRSEILERALADGGFTPGELTAQPPEAYASKFERFIDYQLSWALTNLKRDGLVENPSWGVWRLAGAAREVPAPATEEPIFVDRAQELERMSYQEYLRTPEWRVIRAAALERAGHCCSLDITHTGDLVVHHRFYGPRGHELASDLVVLCRVCHDLHHKQFGRPGPRPAPAATATAMADVKPAAAATVSTSSAPREPRSLLRRLFSA